MRPLLGLCCIAACSLLVSASTPSAIGLTRSNSSAPKGLTEVADVKVGHQALDRRPTGCTVILTEAGATGGVDVRGGAPETRETDLLDPVHHVMATPSSRSRPALGPAKRTSR